MDPLCTRQLTTSALEVHPNLIPKINWDEFEIIDHSEKNMKDWFIELLKKEEVIDPYFTQKIHVREIVSGPDDVYEYVTEKTKIKAQPLLALCYAMKERQKSQARNTYFSVLKEEDNNIFVKVSIGEKIKIQIFPYGKNFLRKSNDKKNLILQVVN